MPDDDARVNKTTSRSTQLRDVETYVELDVGNILYMHDSNGQTKDARNPETVERKEQ